MNVTVTIPDDLYEQVESLACRQEQSRSDLYARALKMLVHTQDDPDQPPSGPSRPEWLDWPSEKITQVLNEVYSEHDSTLDPGLALLQSEAVREDW